EAENAQILKRFEGLRVADVSDGTELESVNRPLVIGGVLVCPGDVVVADGDGVIVVPRNVADQVAKYAHAMLAKGKSARKDLYESLGRPLDKTVKQ
ncbi:MAG: hypothetical protein ACREOI_37630, partial [bacterium]